MKTALRIALAPVMLAIRLMLGLVAFITSITSSVLGLRISGTSNRIWIPFLMMNDLKKDRPSGYGMPSLNTNNTLPEKTDKTTPYDYECRLA